MGFRALRYRGVSWEPTVTKKVRSRLFLLFFRIASILTIENIRPTKEPGLSDKSDESKAQN